MHIGPQEATFKAEVDEAQQVVVIPRHIEQAQSLAVVAQLAPRPHLEDLLHGADAARQGNERVGMHGHAVLALMHGVHNLQACQPRVAHFLFHQTLRDDADHFGTVRQSGIGHRAHQARAATAIHQTPAARTNLAAHFTRRSQMRRVIAIA